MLHEDSGEPPMCVSRHTNLFVHKQALMPRKAPNQIERKTRLIRVPVWMCSSCAACDCLPNCQVEQYEKSIRMKIKHQFGERTYHVKCLVVCFKPKKKARDCTHQQRAWVVLKGLVYKAGRQSLLVVLVVVKVNISLPNWSYHNLFRFFEFELAGVSWRHNAACSIRRCTPT